MTKYQEAKRALMGVSNIARTKYPTDKPAQRQIINDSAYFLSVDYKLTEHQTDLLHNYACNLHPKN